MVASPTEDRKLPYAPPATVLDVIRHFRNFDVPESITQSRLTQLGVADGLLSRTWATCVFLGLMSEDGTTNEQFRAIRFASDVEYPQVLLGILQDVYADIFAVINPAEADLVQLDSAFRLYLPGGQRRRMITLFLGLCREAGIETRVEQRARSSRIGGRTSSEGGRTTPPTRKRASTPPPAVNPPAPPAAATTGIEAVRVQYAEALLAKISESDSLPDAELLDRLERVLGVGSEEKSANDPE